MPTVPQRARRLDPPSLGPPRGSREQRASPNGASATPSITDGQPALRRRYPLTAPSDNPRTMYRWTSSAESSGMDTIASNRVPTYW